MVEFADEVFVEESSVRFYGFLIQTRMAVIRLSGNRLFLYSPVPLRSAASPANRTAPGMPGPPPTSNRCPKSPL